MWKYIFFISLFLAFIFLVVYMMSEEKSTIKSVSIIIIIIGLLISCGSGFMWYKSSKVEEGIEEEGVNDVANIEESEDSE